MADFLGIADGVGGWRDSGVWIKVSKNYFEDFLVLKFKFIKKKVDPSKFSSSLMQQCKRIVEQESNQFSDSNKITKDSPLNILTSSYDTLVESKNADLVGSSTACVCAFNRESKHLHSANLGDSGFVVIRNSKIVHRSRETLHFF
jgi:protein phosphatase PTC7